MCLSVNRNSPKKIATEDIVCYKKVIFDIDFTKYKGKEFTGIINNIHCTGKIQVDSYYAFACTNDPELSNSGGIDKLGYQYSYLIDGDAQSIIIDGVDIMIPTKNSVFMTYYQYAKIKIGETYMSDLVCIFAGPIIEVHQGLHSYVKLKNIIAFSDVEYPNYIVKCIIPKGAEYYEGWFGVSKSYASNQLKYVEIVTK